MKIAVIADLHANLPALRAFLAAVRVAGCDAIFHLGDAIAIGPQPRECLELLLATPRMHLIRGNHESYYLDGLPDPRPAWMSAGEVEHQAWVREVLGPDMRDAVAAWPWLIAEDFAGVRARFQHYALDTSGVEFMPTLRDPDAAKLDSLLHGGDAQVIFFGHDHRFADSQGRARWINPGSLGCQKRAMAPFTVVEFSRGEFTVAHHAVPYDDGELYQAFERRKVPERDFLYRAFFGGRFPG